MDGLIIEYNLGVNVVKVDFFNLLWLGNPKKYRATSNKRLKIFFNVPGLNEFGRKEIFDLANELSLAPSPLQEWSCFRLHRNLHS